MKSFKNTLIQITNAGMGAGDERLGIKLITNYLKLINEEMELPRFIVFYNSGVKVVCKDSPAIEATKSLEEKGVKLISCKTCLNHFDLIDKIEAGAVGSMMDIIDLQKTADKVITI